MAQTYLFDQFRIDLQTYALLQDDKPILVEPMVFDLLLYMVKNPGRLLTRDELIDAIWEGRFVSDSTVSTAIKMARRALNDSGETQTYIQTIRGRGFQFTADVQRNEVEAKPVPLFKQPSLAIAVSSPDESWPKAQAALLTTRLRIVLDRVPLLRIAAQRDTDLAALKSEGVSHLAEVFVTDTGDTLIADAALVEVQTGLQTWARSYSTPNTPGVPEVLLYRIVAQLEPELMRAMVRAFSGQGAAQDPRGLVIEAIGTLATWGWNRASFKHARALLDQALSMDESNATAHAYAGLIRALGHRVGANRDPALLKEGVLHAERALELEAQDSFVLGIAGCALCDAGQLERGYPVLKRSAQINEANGHALTAIGAALIMRGEFEQAVAKLREGIAISPADSRLAVWEALLAMAELIMGNVDEALVVAETALSRDDRNYLSRLAASAVMAARQDARGLDRKVSDLLRVHPELSEDEIAHFAGPDLSVPIWAAVERAREQEDAALV
ncbi:MAG: winged helix-turn-helix domain-containing protein [Pseudomonadota bacterium]